MHLLTQGICHTDTVPAHISSTIYRVYTHIFYVCRVSSFFNSKTAFPLQCFRLDFFRHSLFRCFSLIYGYPIPIQFPGARNRSRCRAPCPKHVATILICGHSTLRKYLHNLNKFMRSSSHFQFAISLPTLLCSGGDSEWHFVCALPVHNLCKYPQRGERRRASLSELWLWH